MTANRKRGRTTQEDETEFMPLSKRINNLHINSNLLLEQQKNQLSSILNAEWGPGPPYQPVPPATSLPNSPPLSVPSTDWDPSIPGRPGPYNPELTETENPYYFNSNKLLYEMYIARHQRNSLEE